MFFSYRLFPAKHVFANPPGSNKQTTLMFPMNSHCIYQRSQSDRISRPDTRYKNVGPPIDGKDTGDDDDKKSDNEKFIQLGKAIDTLRSELPMFFDNNGLVDHSIYRDDIVLCEPHHHKFYIKGKTGYRWFMKCSSVMFKWYYTDLKLHLRSVCHHRHGVDELHVRWTMEGTAKTALLRSNLFSLVWPFSSASTRPGSGDGNVAEKSSFEGVFIYKFDKNGFIYEHQITDIQPPPRRFIPLHAFGWFQRGRISSMPGFNS